MRARAFFSEIRETALLNTPCDDTCLTVEVLHCLLLGKVFFVGVMLLEVLYDFFLLTLQSLAVWVREDFEENRLAQLMLEERMVG